VITAVADASQVAEARRLVREIARSAGIADARVAEIAIVVTELATNLLKHGRGGHILANRYDDGGGDALHVLALDQGGGMTDVNRCMEDGYSTAGSPGTGLGAIARLADELLVYSRTGLGSVIAVRFRAGNGRDAGAHGVVAATQLGAVAAQYPGEHICGDQWAFRDTAHGPTLLVADGAGHGAEAARAAQAAVQTFLQQPEAPTEALVDRIHRALMPTRGAAVAIARIDTAARLVRFTGVGNICGALVTAEGPKHMVSHNGTAGHVAPRIREFTYPYTGRPLVLLHSDGITSRWDLGAYPGLVGQHPSLVAGVLLRDHRRTRDDATVVAMRQVA
jgi:anti-sigma regulatory factor (Ser/Thr protein kinase)